LERKLIARRRRWAIENLVSELRQTVLHTLHHRKIRTCLPSS